jgi:hypothetical protein
MQLEAPTNQIAAKLADLGYYDLEAKRPRAITKWIYMKPEDLILRFNAVSRGYVNYYSFADNKRMMQFIMWILKYSFVYTLCRKWNISVPKVFKKLGKDLKIEVGTKVYKLETHNLDPTPLKFIISGKPTIPDPAKLKYFSVRSKFSLDKRCVLCGSQ